MGAWNSFSLTLLSMGLASFRLVELERTTQELGLGEAAEEEEAESSTLRLAASS